MNRVSTNTERKELETNKRTLRLKYQLILNIFVMKIKENKVANNNEKKIMGINKTNDSNKIRIVMLDFSKPRILKTRFW
tara:strand:+ start:1856 stop:2092 length:237 start_codon:yes stop_codon:yes gene_type:complete